MKSRTESVSCRATRGSMAALMLGAALLFASCGSTEESADEKGVEAGPLTAAEKAYIKQAEEHQELVLKGDAKVNAGTLEAKQQHPEAGLPVEVLDATQEYLDSRSKAFRSWEDTECPSERFGELCDLWRKELGLQDRWDNRVVVFINEPYSADRFKAVVEAGREEGTQWKRCKAEIKKLEREAEKK